MKLFLIRHLPTPWNLEKRLQGTKDISIATPTAELNEVVSDNLKLLKEKQWNRVLVSEKVRTHETAKHFEITEFVVEPLLNELDFGKFEGGPKSNLLNELGNEWLDDVLPLKLGESMLGFQTRLMAFIDSYRMHDMVLAFTHGAVIRGLKCIHEDGNISRMNRFDIPNGSIEILEF